MSAVIDPMNLDQTLIVAPELPFARLAAALEGLGWRRDGRAPLTADMIPGEPELAGWDNHGKKPVITYTMNPVVRLRVLDVATVPPRQRAAIAEAVPLLNPDRFAGLIADPDPRRCLLGAFAARECQRAELAPAIAARASAPGEVGALLDSARQALERVAVARLEGLHAATQVAAGALPMLAALASPGGAELLASFQPQPTDYALVFDAEIASQVRVAMSELWRSPPRINPGAEYSEIEVTAAPAGMFRTNNELSWKFPQGYREIAGWLEPRLTWLRWRYRRPGQQSGVSYDGLVWMGSRWVWFPKPFRPIGEILNPKPH